MKRFTILSLAAVISGTVSYAQKRTSISPSEKNDIVTAAKNTLSNYEGYLSLISRGKEVARAKYFPGGALPTFYNSSSKIEDDLDIPPTTGNNMDVDAYISKYRDEFPSNEDNEVNFTVKRVYNVQLNDNIVSVAILFDETFQGKNKRNLPFPAHKRIANMIAKSSAGKWEALITGVTEYDESHPYDDISHAAPIEKGSEVAKAAKPDAYYKNMLKQGDVARDNNNFADAYVCYKEAGNAKNYHEEAGRRINNLQAKMADAGISMDEYDNYLVAKLSAKGAALTSKKRYEAAKRYYDEALFIRPTDKDIPVMTYMLDSLVSIQKDNESLIEKGAYTQAAVGFSKAINDDPNNASLYAGLAEAYGHISGKDDKANENFRKAIALDPTNASIYETQARYLKYKRKYAHAYESYSSYVTNIEDKTGPDAQLALAEMSSCKGIIALNRKEYYPARDSFMASINYAPNAEAYCYLGRCYYMLKESDSALYYIEAARRLNPKYTEAQYWHGHILAFGARSDKGSQSSIETGIAEMTDAVRYDPYNGEWNLGLGKALQTQKKYDEAIACYDVCIKYDSVRTSDQAYRQKGQCQLRLGQYGEAINNYNSVRSLSAFDKVNKANIYANMKICDSASRYYAMFFDTAKIGTYNAETMLGKAKAVYYCNNSYEKSRDLFEEAFKKGIPREILENDETISYLEREEPDFRRMKRKYE